MNEEEQQVLASLASTLAATRAELDAMRMLLTASMALLAARPENLPAFAAGLNAVIETDTAFTLPSPMTDDMLQMRTEWLKRLTPPPLLPLVRFP